MDADLTPVTTKRADAEGTLRREDLVWLLDDVPDRAEITITQSDLDRGDAAHWFFTAKWVSLG